MFEETEHGSRAWILPVLLEGAALIWEIAWGRAASVWHGFFWVAGPGRGEEPWLVVLLTLPTWSCCSYSAAMWWRLHARRASSHPWVSNATQ